MDSLLARAPLRRAARALLLEHARYFALCAALLLAMSGLHPARLLGKLLQPHTAHACRSSALSEAMCGCFGAEHIQKGTHAAVLAYLLYFYVSKALPKQKLKSN
mmetsp:Transcript_4362/g.8939  ORF Transcript_4362/g.8939 Transcript_4362/m.8939 type:complete len:104 (-) Transcript_4362:244-555(-)